MIFCENPKKGANGRWFKCNHCPACNAVKANEKILKSIFAANEYMKKGQFLTLTYRDEYLPNGLKHVDFSGFMKRLRRDDGTPDVKIFMAGEYGEKSGREHFHVLVYNHRFDIDKVEKAWNKGFVYDGTLSPKSIKYVSGYVSKKGYDPESGKRKPYGRMSCNLPDNLTEDEILEMCKNGYVEYQGNQRSVPATWKYRYKELWDSFKDLRYWKSYEKFVNGDYKNNLTPEYVRGLMRERELRRVIRKKGAKNAI